MKRYIKPEVTVIEIETSANLMQASLDVDKDGTHDGPEDRAKGGRYTFDIWDLDEEDD